MNDERRAILREIKAQIEVLEQRTHEIWLAEESDFESRLNAAKASAQGIKSRESVKSFENISTSLSEAIDEIDEILS